MLRVLSILGPGLMYAAAAVGVSHLVQSTRAGASFGYSLMWPVIIANIIKYPFFKVGCTYPSLTGKSLLDGYKNISRYALVITTVINFMTLFLVQAAITIVTAGLLKSILSVQIDILLLSGLILFSCSLILIIGKYTILDNLIKVIMLVLFVTTIACVIISYPKMQSFQTVHSFSFSSKSDLFFLIAFMGWMPAPMDVPIWQSLWSVEKNKSSERTLKESVLDFNIGYLLTIVLALCFVLLGAWIMHGQQQGFSPKAVGFASQLLEIFTLSLGPWSYPIIAIACFTTMFSTCFACLDAFSRMSSRSIELLEISKSKSLGPSFFLVLISSVSMMILLLFLKDMKSLVDFVTSISFIIAPIYCYLNYRLTNDTNISRENRPSKLENIISKIFIFLMLCFSFCFIYLRFLE